MTATPDGKLRTLLESFVRVRLVQMGGVDLSLFQFDPFLSWSLFFMNGDKTIYGRFGTASPNTKRDRKDSNPNHTRAGLIAALRRALEIHSGYSKDPKSWSHRLAGKIGPKPHWKTTAANPAARKYRRLKRVTGADHSACVHCHEVQRTVIDSYFMTKRRVTDNMLWLYPRPEVLGLTLSRDHCARVVRVAKGSYAEYAGVKASDDIVVLRGQPLVSIADVQFVLQNFPDAGGALPLRVRRANKTITLRLILPKLWRRAEDFGWRYRVAGYAMWLWAGVTFADDARGVRVAQLSPNWFKRPNRKARSQFKPGDIIVDVDGERSWTRSTLIAYLMRDKKLGSIVRLKVRRRGKIVALRFSLPKTQPEVQGY